MQPEASDDIHTHVARKRPSWTTRPGWRALRARRPRSSLVLGVLVLAAVVSTRWVRLNCSPSSPLGLYRLTALPTPLERGTLVVLPVPPEVGAWHSRWVPLLKPVAAIAGDTVCVVHERLLVEGQDYGLVLAQAHGTPLLRMEGCVTLADGEVFLASPAHHSLDGRYFGPIAQTALTAQAIPVLTWR